MGRRMEFIADARISKKKVNRLLADFTKRSAYALKIKSHHYDLQKVCCDLLVFGEMVPLKKNKDCSHLQLLTAATPMRRC